jgi:hypothetical protein
VASTEAVRLDVRFPRRLPVGQTYDVVYVKVGIATGDASLVWSRATKEGPARLDLHHVEGLTQSQLVQLWQARTLVALDFTRILPGPKRGETTALPLNDFPGRYEAARAAVSAGPDPLTVVNVAAELGVHPKTLYNHLRRAGMRWKPEPGLRRRRPFR